jgi:hypothetical protein
MKPPNCDLCSKPLRWRYGDYGIKLTRCQIHIGCVGKALEKFYPEVWSKQKRGEE